MPAKFTITAEEARALARSFRLFVSEDAGGSLVGVRLYQYDAYTLERAAIRLHRKLSKSNKLEDPETAAARKKRADNAKALRFLNRAADALVDLNNIGEFTGDSVAILQQINRMRTSLIFP
jgi:hypothetical protein